MDFKDELLKRQSHWATFQIRFLGGKLGKALAQEYDVSTVGDLLCVLAHQFTVYG